MGHMYIVHIFILTLIDVIAINLRRILFGKREREMETEEKADVEQKDFNRQVKLDIFVWMKSL